MAAAPDPDEVLCSTAGKANFHRVTRLLIAGGTTLLREIFDNLCPLSNLPTVLSNPATQKQLKAAKLTKPQWDCLYPSPGVYGKSTDFDVTLLFRLLRAICGLTPPATGWDVLPPNSDYSLTAELARIKYYRNSVYGHVNQSMEITDDEFPSLWQEISGALVRIAGQISATRKHEWQSAVDKFLKDPLTLEDERNTQELDLWYSDDMEVKKSIERLHSASKEVREATEEVREGIERLEIGLEEKTDQLKDQLGEVRQSLESLSSMTASTQSAAAVRVNVRIDCETVTGPGTKRESTRQVTTPQPEPLTVAQGAARVAPITSNSQVACLPTNFGKRNIPSEGELFRSIAAKYLQDINPSSPDEYNRFLEYLIEIRKVLFVGAQVGSLIITVECNSLLILDELWEDYYTGYLNEMAQKCLVTEGFLKEFGLTEVKLMTMILETEYRKCRLDFWCRSVELTKSGRGSISSGGIEIIIASREVNSRYERFFALAVDSDDSIENVKKKIQDKVGILPSEQRLRLFGRSPEDTLSDYKSLSDYNINSGHILFLYIANESLLNIEIAIRSLTGRMITVAMTPTSTVESVKTKIQLQEKIPWDQQHLVFGDKVLEEDKKLKDYRIKHKSIIRLKEILREIFIKTLSGKKIELNVVPSDSIRMVKQKREKEEGFPPGKIPILAFDGRQLDDNATLAQHNIQMCSTLCEVARDELEDPASKNVLHFSVSFSLKIADKPLTEEAVVQGIGFGGALAALLYKQPEQVEKALRSVLEAPGIQVENITVGSILVTLRCCSRQRFLTFLLEFERKEAKERLESQMRGIGFKENLEIGITNRKEVDETFDEIRTSRYTTDKEQELVDALEAYLPQEKIKICVELPTGRRDSLEFKLSDTIKMVKNKIEVTEGIPAVQQLLKLDGHELEGNHRLSYYDIQEKSAVELIVTSMKIFVRTAIIGGEVRTLSFYVNPSDTVKSVKLKIQEKFRILPEEQRLTYLVDGDLKDELTLTHYNIQNHSRLRLLFRY